MKLPDLVLMEEAVKANDYQKFKELALGKKQQGLYGAKDVNIADTCIRKRVIEFTVDGCKPEQLDGLLTFARQAIKDDLCSKTLVCALVLDALELTHIQECEPLFDVFVKHEAIWKHEPFYTTLKAMMLRVCNSINKRLSAHDDAQLSGKILQFLARRLNLCEPSGLNKPGAINNEYITTWQEFSEETAEADGEDVKEPESMETDDLEQGEIKEEEGPSLPPSQSEEPAPVALDRKLYAKFWRLQNFFASPNDIFATDKFNEFNDCLEAVFEAFRSHRVQKRRKRRRVVKPQNGPTDTEQESFYEVDDILNGLDDICAIEPGSSFDAKRDDMFCCRFFTDFEFFEQQMCDLKIRRCFLVQCLILFQYLQSDSKSKDKSLKLSAEQSLTIVEAIKTCYDLLAEVGTGNVTRSARFAKSVKNVLDREIYWNKWKFEGANAYTLNPSVDDIPMPEWKRRPRQKFSFSEVDLGNATMTRIWSNSGTLLDECAKRKFYPVAKEFLTDPLEELDPEAQIEDQYLSLNKDLIQFRMSRFLARQSSAYYTCNTNNQLADSLKGYLKKAIVSGAKLVPELQADAAAIGEKLGKIEEAEKQRLEKERAAARKRLEEEKAQKVKLEEQRKAKLAEEKKVHKAKTEKTPHRAVEVTKTPDRASKTVRTPSSDKLNKDSPKVAKTPTRSEKSDRLSEKTPLKTPEKNARMSDSKSPPKKRAREESPGRSDSPVPIDEGALSPVDVATPVSSDD